MFITLTKQDGKRFTLSILQPFSINECAEGEGCDVITGSLGHRVTETHDQITEQYLAVVNRAAANAGATVARVPLDGVPPNADEVEAEFNRAVAKAEAAAEPSEPAPTPDAKPKRVRNR